MPSLRKFAKNKGISIKGSTSKDDLVDAILPDVRKPPLDASGLYNSLDDKDKDFVSYLLVNKGGSNISDISRIIHPTNWYSRSDMRAVKSILLRIVPTGLVFVDPPSQDYYGLKEERYRFYIPNDVRDLLCTEIIKVFEEIPEPKIKEQSIEDIVKTILLKKIDNELDRELPRDARKITVLMEDSINIDNLGIYSNYRKRYLRDVTDLYKSMIATAVAHLPEKERKLYFFLSDMPKQWFDEHEILDILDKYAKKKFNPKTKTRMQALGLVKTTKVDKHNLIRIADSTLKESTKKSSIESNDNELYISHDRLNDLSIEELYIVLRYFNLEDAKGRYILTISLSKAGHALENGEDIETITQTIGKCTNLDMIKETLTEIDNKFGNFLLHKHLAIYEVNDPSIYYRMDKSYKNKSYVYLLNDKYLLIPERERKDGEQFIRRSGFVIKERAM